MITRNSYSAFLFFVAVLLFCSMTNAQQSRSGPVPSPSTDRGYRTFALSQNIISNVPSYLWHHGCGNTALGMVIGYFDGLGYDDLVVGDASTETPAVRAMIANDHENTDCTGALLDHYRDYSCPKEIQGGNILPDRSELGGAHADNCVADYMLTSRSSVNNPYGQSWFDDVPNAFIDYVNQVAPQYNPISVSYIFDVNAWNFYKAEIDADRPVVLLVDNDGDGETDHFVTGIGYDDAVMEYGIYDTWDNLVHWYQWREISTSYTWGVYGFSVFRLNSCMDDIYEPDDICPPSNTMTFGTPQSHILCNEDWVKFNATAGQIYDIATHNLIDDTHTRITLYGPTCTDWIDSNVSSGDDGGSWIVRTLNTSGEYFVKIIEDNGNYGQGKGYDILVNEYSDYNNDYCPGAPITQFPYSAIADTRGHIDDFDGVYCINATHSAPDLVWNHTARCNQTLQITVTQTMLFDPILSVVSDCSDPSGSCVASADLKDETDPEVLQLNVTEGVTYYMIIDGFYPRYEKGSFILDVIELTMCPVETVPNGEGGTVPVILSESGSDIQFDFDYASGATFYNVYRGNLDDLIFLGLYNHNTKVTDNSCSGSPDNVIIDTTGSLSDADNYYFLINGNNGTCEGSSGSDSSGTPRENGGFWPSGSCYSLCP